MTMAAGREGLFCMGYMGLGPVATTTSAPPSAQVHVSLATAVHVTDERFLSLAIDQGAFLKPKQWNSWTAKMGDPIVAALCKQLRPAYLRLGGTASATVTYSMDVSPSSPSAAAQPPSMHPQANQMSLGPP